MEYLLPENNPDAKWVPGFEGKYFVTRDGHVYSASYQRTGKVGELKGCLAVGYRQIKFTISKDEKHSKTVHRLVAEAFCHKPADDCEVNHIDGNKLNNSADNLEWVTRRRNVLHAYAIGLMAARKGEKSPRAKLTDDLVRKIKVACMKIPAYRVAREFNIPVETVTGIKYGKTWKHIEVDGKILSTRRDLPVKEIKKALQEGNRSNADIARQFGIGPGIVSRIKLGKTWKHIQID